MATTIDFLLNGASYIQPRQAEDFEIEATFDGDSIQPNVTTTRFNFVDTDTSKPNAAIRSWFANTPTEGMPLTIIVSDDDDEISFDFYLDFKTLEILSDIELEIGVVQVNSLTNLDIRSRGISMRLLLEEGYLTDAKSRDIPYIVENRKTALEFVLIGFQLYQIVKQSIDEVFKIVNIAADFLSAGIGLALINLAATAINLAVLIFRSLQLLNEIEEALFPTMKFHKGFTILEYTKALFAKMGYEFTPEIYGNYSGGPYATIDHGKVNTRFNNLIANSVLCPSKSDEVGTPLKVPKLKKQLVNPGDGILKPNDFGYMGNELLELIHDLAYTKLAIKGTEVRILPLLSPTWWTETIDYDFPDVKIEQAFVKNGSFTYNYDEMYGRHYIEYAKDSSDGFTLTNVNERISEVIVVPDEVVNEKNIVEMPLDLVEIPYALAVRRPDEKKNIFTKFLTNKDELIKGNKELQKEYEANGYTDEFGETKPPVINAETYRNGAMMVEHDYFSTPKLVYLNDKDRIPISTAVVIGAPDITNVDIPNANNLRNNFHVFKSFKAGSESGVPGKGLGFPTPQKKLYPSVEIDFRLKDFIKTIESGLFNFDSKKGKFESIKWKIYKDRAVTKFYVMENWNFNMKEIPITDDFAIVNIYE